MKFQSQIQIPYAISNNGKETMFSPESGVEIEVRRPEPKKKGGGRIIITTDAYEEIGRQLILLGYIPMEDFLDYEMAEVLLTQKKIALLYGFCHIRGVADCLKHAPGFASQYQIFYYANYLSHSAYQEMRFSALVAKCDLLVYGMEMTAEHYRWNEAVLQRIKQSTRKLCLPAVFFGAYFPQTKRMYNSMNPYAVKSAGHDYTPFSYGDSWLNHCIDEGMTADAVMEHFRGKIYEKSFILDYLEKELRHLRFQEQKGDFLFVDYIEENFRTHRVFRNEAHMENGLLEQYTLQVLYAAECDSAMFPVKEPLMRCSQHLIFPCVADALKLEWNVEEELLDVYTYGGWKRVSVQEYIELYIDSCSKVRSLKKRSLLP